MGRVLRKRRPSRRPPRVLQILAVASTASALSLANFQLITSNAIPSPCIVAYNSQISGCTNTDFTNGNRCSNSCINGLASVSSIVNAICGGLNVNPQSLLGLTLDGLLLETLCPGSNVDTTTVRVTVQPSRTSSIATTSSPPPAIITSEVPPPATTSTDIETTSSDGGDDPPTETSTAVQTSEVTATTTSASSQVTQVTNTQSNNPPTDGPTGATEPGGGSPFDTVVQAQAAVSSIVRTTNPLFLAAGVALLLTL
ncbi:uncharacterized protein JN550_010029 [Neoarthrinium moseri]|uniref:uncharacterized protein n=1 Tax=Neoarthrinium moseri TaxID=1658444 RepID=UPI001FDE02D6|nr:uncharacterized protein JN550_010029 [Neoarthrinium moseri]KAI1862692.1 hypothetical protein JN550_010029 [Neoarthrinium moseri]